MLSESTEYLVSTMGKLLHMHEIADLNIINSENFARVLLFSQNFAGTKFHKNKNPRQIAKSLFK